MVLDSRHSYPRAAGGGSRGGYLPLIVLFVVLAEAQVVFGEALSINASVPDLLLPLAVACGIFRGREDGLWMGLAAGLVQDLASGTSTPLGQQALSKMFIGWLAGGVATLVRRTSLFIPLFFIPLASALNLVILGFLSSASQVGGGGTIGGALVANGVYGVPLYYLVSFLPGSVES